MKLSKIRLNFINKFFNSPSFTNDRRQILTNKLKKYYDTSYVVYMKLSRSDIIEDAQNKVSICQHDLRKFRENQEDISSELIKIRFKMSETSSLKHEADRLKDDARYLECVKQERELNMKKKLLKSNYYNTEKREQNLKDAFSVAREELHTKQKEREGYLRVFGLIIPALGFLVFIVRTKYESNSMQTYFKDHQKYVANELNQIKKYFDDNQDKSSNSAEGFTYKLIKYSGISLVLSLFGRKDDSHISDVDPRNEDISSSENLNLQDKTINNLIKSGNISYRSYAYYLGKYSGVNYIASWLQSSENHESKENKTNSRDYLYYIGKYSGANYLISWFPLNKPAGNQTTGVENIENYSYSHYIGKYSGVSYLKSWMWSGRGEGNESKRNDADN